MVASPTLIEGDDIQPEDVTKYPLLQASHRHDSWLRWFEVKGVLHSGQLQGPRFAQTVAMIEAASAGLGLAVLPMAMIERQLDDGRLRLVAGDPVPSGFGYYVVVPQTNAHRTDVMHFRDWISRESRAYRKR